MTFVVNDTSRELWNGFDDNITKMESEPGLEKFNPVRFKRTYQLYLIAHFVNRIVEPDDKFELPNNSVLHVLDDLYHPDDHQDTPRVNQCELITRESWRKYIYHVKDFKLDGPISVTDKYIYRQSGLPVSLMHFKSEQGANFRYLENLDKIPKMPNILTVINHNPLFRVRFLGNLQYFRKIRLILTSILNTVDYIAKHTDKQQFLLIPWTGEVYQRSAFVRSRLKLDKLTVKYNESFQYIFMMHLLNYMWDTAVTSIFDKLDDTTLSKLNIVLQANKKYFIFNLKDIRDFNDNNRVYLKFSNQLNLLAILGHPELYTKSDKETIMSQLDEDTTEYTEEDTKEVSTTKTYYKKNNKTDEDVEATIEVVNNNTKKEQDKVSNSETKHNPFVIGTTARAKDLVKSATASTPIGTFGITAVDSSGKKSIEINEPLKVDEVIPAELEPVETKESYEQIMDTAAVDFIESKDYLTPKQKEYFKKQANLYKSIKVGNETIEQILNKKIDTKVNPDESMLKADKLGIPIEDKSQLETTLSVFDKEYLEKSYKRDLVTTLTSFKKNGVFLTGLKEEREVTDLNDVTKYTASYIDIDGKKSTVKLTIPNVRRDGKILLDGVPQILRKQRIALPIVKINDLEVSLASNQNKTRVIRNTAKAHSYFSTIENLVNKSKGKINIVYGTYKTAVRLPYEYSAIAERYKEINFTLTGKHAQLYFDYPTRVHFYGGDEKKLLKLESELGTYIGRYGNSELFLDGNNNINCFTQGKGQEAFAYSRLIEFLAAGAELPPEKFRISEWVNIKILDKLIPVIFVLAYHNGLRHTLDDLGIKYSITEGRSKQVVNGSESIYPDAIGNSVDNHDTIDDIETKIDVDAVPGTEDINDSKFTPVNSDIPIYFADKVLWIARYPLKYSLVVAGLCNYNLRAYELNEFESKDVYFEILQSAGMSTNYLKGIDSFFDLFVDGMTFEVLKSMKMPTTVTGLLYKAAEMLSTVDSKPVSSRYNHRLRGPEQINAIIYNELARQFAAYQAGRGASNTFSVNPDAVYLRIIQNQALVPAETPNPIQDLKFQAAMTYSGVGGRDNESFVINDRRYDESDVGFISEATVDNGSVGLNAQLSFNPGITDTLGNSEVKDPSKLDAGQLLSAASVLAPFVTKDDGKRMNFVSIQSAHMVPVINSDLNRVRTGYERIVAHRVGREFACVASDAGKVTNIDEKSKTIEVTYKNGKVDIYQYGDIYTEVQSFEATQSLICAVKIGQTLEKGDIIAYNKGFFNQDPVSKQVDFSFGVRANVAFIETDSTSEDSTEISKRLSDKLAFEPVNPRYVTINKNSKIYSTVHEGDHVLNTDPLMIVDEDPVDSSDDGFKTDETTLSLLGDLNKRTPRAKFNGEITRIEAFTSCPVSEMSPSVASLFKQAVELRNRRARIAKGTEAEDDFVQVTLIPKGSKYKGQEFTGEEVMFVYHIKETLTQRAGDKMVFGGQLKCTVAKVMDKPTYTDSGREIDAFFSASAVARRIVLSIYLSGISARCLEKIQDEFIKIYRGKNKK